MWCIGTEEDESLASGAPFTPSFTPHKHISLRKASRFLTLQPSHFRPSSTLHPIRYRTGFIQGTVW